MENGLENLSSDLSNYERDFLKLQSLIEDLREKFPNQFVAVKEGEVISNGVSVEKVVDELNKRGIEPSGTVIEFISSTDQMMVL